MASNYENNQKESLNEDLNHCNPPYQDVELDADQHLQDTNTIMMNQMNPTLQASPGTLHDNGIFTNLNYSSDDEPNSASPALDANMSVESDED